MKSGKLVKNKSNAFKKNKSSIKKGGSNSGSPMELVSSGEWTNTRKMPYTANRKSNTSMAGKKKGKNHKIIGGDKVTKIKDKVFTVNKAEDNKTYLIKDATTNKHYKLTTSNLYADI